MDTLTVILAAGFVIALVAAVGLGWACYWLLLDRGRILLRQPEIGGDGTRDDWQGLAPGSVLPDVALPTIDGRTITLSSLSQRPLLLIFAQPTCLFTRTLACELAASRLVPNAPLPVVIVSGEAPDGEALAPFVALPGPVLLDPHGQVARLARVTITPVGYLLDTERRTLGAIIVGPAALLAAIRDEPRIDELALPAAVSRLRRIEASVSPLPIGAEAPPFTLPMLNGEPWSLPDQRGRELILVFSDPGCPPCAPLLAALGERPDERVIVISRGDTADNEPAARSVGLTAPVLLQRTREVARAYGVLETPAAYQIDAAGKIAAGPVIGAEGVLDLLAGATTGGRSYSGHRLRRAVR